MCLQWEPEIIAVAMLHLAAKLRKYDVNNWVGKTASQTLWWEMFVEGLTLDLVEGKFVVQLLRIQIILVIDKLSII